MRDPFETIEDVFYRLSLLRGVFATFDAERFFNDHERTGLLSIMDQMIDDIEAAGEQIMDCRARSRA